MAREAVHAVEDMLDEIDWVTSVVAGKSFAEFCAQRTTRYAVERSVEIMSEASRRLTPDLTSVHPEIPWRAIAAIGNILRHEYHVSSPKVIWDVVQDDLPALRSALAHIRRSLRDGPET